MVSPLAHRIPNPPVAFVGRTDALGVLVDLLERSGLACVSGPGGSGKSALVRQLLRRERPEWGRRALKVTIGANETLDEALLTLANALGVADAPSLARSQEALLGELLSVAERDHRIVVVDNVHHADGQALLALVELLADFALDSRWLLLGRGFPPGLTAAEQLLSLEPLDSAALSELAVRCGCPEDSVGQAIEVAAGSPLRLRQWVAFRSQLGDLASVPEEAQDLLRMLARLELPLPLKVASQMVSLPAGPLLAALETSGWLQQSPDDAGLRMHDSLRETVQASLSPDERQVAAGRVAQGLSHLNDPASASEALKAALDASSPAALEQVLKAHGELLLTHGRAAWMWRQLVRRDEPAARRWCLRAAVTCATAEAVAWAVEQPRPEALPDLIAWLEAMILGARFDVVLEATAAMSPVAAPSDDEAWLSVQKGRALMHLGRVDEVEAALGPLTGRVDELALVRDVLLARARLHLGDHRRGVGLLHAIDQQLDLSPRIRDIIDEQRNLVIMTAGNVGDRAKMLDGRDMEQANRTTRLLAAGQLLLAGEVTAAREAVGAFDDQPLNPVDRVLAGIVRGGIAAMEVRTGDCRRAFGDALDTGRAHSLWMLYNTGLNGWLCQAAGLRAQAPRAHLEARPLQGTPTRQDSVVRAALQWLWSLDLGQPFDPPDMEGLEAMSVDSATRALTEWALSRVELMSGRPLAADALAAAALRRSREAGWVVMAAASLHDLAISSAARGDGSAFQRSADELLRTGVERSLPLFRQLGQLFTAAAGPHPDLPTIDRLAMLAPGPASNWARALFGCPRVWRTYDRVAVEALSGLWRPRRRLGRTSEDWSDGWGYDAVAGVAWRLDGAIVKLGGRRVARRLLECLARHGGTADKAALVRFGWSQAEYHPLRDDNRLHVAMRRLRGALEALGYSAPLLETTDDGYRISPALAFAWAVDDDQEEGSSS